MKKVVIKFMLFAIIAITGSSIFFSAKAQSEAATPNVYAVINKADWCPVCKANGARIMTEVMPACKDLKVKFVANDLTNRKTIAKSAKELKKENIFDAVKQTKATGLILLVDKKTKKIIKQVSVSRPTDEIIQEIKAAQG